MKTQLSLLCGALAILGGCERPVATESGPEPNTSSVESAEKSVPVTAQRVADGSYRYLIIGRGKLDAFEGAVQDLRFQKLGPQLNYQTDLHGKRFSDGVFAIDSALRPLEYRFAHGAGVAIDLYQHVPVTASPGSWPSTPPNAARLAQLEKSDSIEVDLSSDFTAREWLLGSAGGRVLRVTSKVFETILPTPALTTFNQRAVKMGSALMKLGRRKQVMTTIADVQFRDDGTAVVLRMLRTVDGMDTSYLACVREAPGAFDASIPQGSEVPTPARFHECGS